MSLCEHIVLSELHDMNFRDGVWEVAITKLRILQRLHQTQKKLVQECNLQNINFRVKIKYFLLI